VDLAVEPSPSQAAAAHDGNSERSPTDIINLVLPATEYYRAE
jgi:hypothetical protein